jgi:hypothetical protein
MSNIQFYKKGTTPPKKDERVGFTFPSLTADLEFDTMNELKMEPALRRFAQRLIDQTNNKEIIGIKITGIDIVYILKKEEQ